MASNLRLIRPSGSLARSQTQLASQLVSLPTAGSFGTSAVVRQAFAATLTRHFSSAASGSGNGGSSSKDDVKNSIRSAETEVQKKLASEAERQRIAAQDAALKEILDSAAAEKQKIEEELARAAEATARQAAKAAEEAAAKAAHESAKRKAKEEAERLAAEKLKQASKDRATRASEPFAQSTRQDASSIHSASTSPTAKESQLKESAHLSSSPSQSTSSATSEGLDAVKRSSSAHAASEDPLEPIKARLLPYKKSLASSTEYMKSAIPDSLRQLTESVKRKDYKDTISQLSEHLNNFTGYNAINDLKHKVIAHGDALDSDRIKLVQSKQAYEDAIATRSNTQKAINDLLQRKHLWSPNDVIRFTDLYRSEHANEQAEQQTKTAYKQAEANVEEKSRKLTRVIMERYHEEQVWSDKIRAASTYGTWGLIGVNVMAFMIVQAFVEPRRRRKQVERYEELVQDLTERGILPDKSITAATAVHTTSAVNDSAAAGSASLAVPVESSGQTMNEAPVEIGGALLGGDDVLSKMIQSAERQEERLARMEEMMRHFPDAVLANENRRLVQEQDSGEPGEYIIAEDGTVMFVSEAESVGAVEMGDAWREELARGSSRAEGIDSENRLARILKNADEEVMMKRRDVLLSGLGGAILGGLVTLAVMMNR